MISIPTLSQLGMFQTFADSSLPLLVISRSEQAAGSVFHPRDQSGKNDCDFLGPSWCNIRVYPET